MRRQFLRVYSVLFVVSLVVSLAMQLLALREIRQQVDQRLLDGFGEPVLYLRDRLLAFEDEPEPPPRERGKPTGNQFADEAAAEAAFKAGKIKRGDRIVINGVSGVWE